MFCHEPRLIQFRISLFISSCWARPSL